MWYQFMFAKCTAGINRIYYGVYWYRHLLLPHCTQWGPVLPLCDIYYSFFVANGSNREYMCKEACAVQLNHFSWLEKMKINSKISRPSLFLNTSFSRIILFVLIKGKWKKKMVLTSNLNDNVKWTPVVIKNNNFFFIKIKSGFGERKFYHNLDVFYH